MTTEKAKRTPRDSESITKGAISLPLQERVDLVKALQKSITDEVTSLKTQADTALAISNGIANPSTVK